MMPNIAKETELWFQLYYCNMIARLLYYFSKRFSNNDTCNERGLFAVMEVRLSVLGVLLLFPAAPVQQSSGVSF